MKGDRNERTGDWTRRGFLRAGLGAAAGLTLGAVASRGRADPAAAAKKRPNIIYIVTDDGGREFSCYGAAYKTPHVDALAAGGVRFTNACVAATCCSPSRGCFYTGRYAHCNGLMGLANRGWALPAGTKTIVDSLNAAGYDTVHIGKHHERPGRVRRPHGYKHNFCSRGGRDPDTCQTRADRCVAAAKTYVESRRAGAPPFFTYIGTRETHSPVHWPIYRPFKPRIDQVKLPGFLPDSPVVAKAFSAFLGAQGFLDRQIGELTAFLAARGLDRNTLVIFTSDHGTSFRRCKGTVYEAGIGVALTMRWPGVIKPGAVAEELVSNIDLMPTILDAAGAAVPENVQGRSLMPLLAGGSYTSRKYLFAERNWHENFKPHRSVRDERHKLILNLSTGPDRPTVAELDNLKDWHDFAFRRVDRPAPLEELYDLRADPHETTNLAGRKELRDVQERLREALRTWMTDTGDFLRGAETQIFWPEQEAKLLGK